MTKATRIINLAIAGVVLAVVVVFLIGNAYRSRGLVIVPANTDTTITEPSTNDWVVHSQIEEDDSAGVLRVSYDQKYGHTVVLYCRVVFENKKENKYRCVAPWTDKYEVERSNISNFVVEKTTLNSLSPDDRANVEVR